LLDRVHRWFDRQPSAGDHLVALAAVLVVVGELASGRLISYDTVVAPTTIHLVLSLAMVAPLAFGPRAPVAAFAAVMATCLVQVAVTDKVLAANVAPLVALYYLIVHGPRRLKPVGLAVALIGGAVMSARALFPGVLDGFVLGTIVVTAEVLVAALLGERRLSRRAQLTALAVERDQQAAIGAARERARIARELHDVVAHSLAVMVAQADGGRYAAPHDPEAASHALAQIAETGRDALAQMRRLLGVLRTDEEGADIPGLVRRVARTGLPVELEVDGPPRDLAPEVELCLHRVAQEALTNVLKHAVAPRRVEVVLRYLESEVELSVRDDGRAAAAGDGQGHGLAGMRERVALHGRHGGRRPRAAAATRSAPGCGRRGRPREAAGVTRVFLVDDQALVRAGSDGDRRPARHVGGRRGAGRPRGARAPRRHHRRRGADGRPHAAARRGRRDAGAHRARRRRGAARARS
jgi:signal transduction histidine kinase